MIIIILSLAIIEFIICYRAVWIINFNFKKGKDYFLSSGYSHIYENIGAVLKRILKDRDLFFVSAGASEFGNIESSWFIRFLLSLIYVPLKVFGILEIVFCVLFTVVALMLLSILHLSIVIIGSIIFFILSKYKGNG